MRNPSRSGGRDTRVDRGNHIDEGIQDVIAQTGLTGLLDPVPRANLAAAGHRDREAEEMLLALGQERASVRLAEISNHLSIIVGHARAPFEQGEDGH